MKTHWVGAAILLASVACAHSASDPPAAGALFDCPRGTELVGAQPPQGFEMYCMRRGENGGIVSHGRHARWWPDGQPQYEASFIDGVIERGIGWCKNGTTAITVSTQRIDLFYCSGTKQASLILGDTQSSSFYAESGVLVATTEGPDGMTFDSTVYYEDGKPIVTVPVVNGATPDGEVKFFDRKEQVVATEVFQDGQTIRETGVVPPEADAALSVMMAAQQELAFWAQEPGLKTD